MYVFCISVLGPKKVIKNNGTDVFKRKKLEETLEEFNELQLKDKRLTLKNHFLHREILREKEMAKSENISEKTSTNFKRNSFYRSVGRVMDVTWKNRLHQIEEETSKKIKIHEDSQHFNRDTTRKTIAGKHCQQGVSIRKSVRIKVKTTEMEFVSEEKVEDSNLKNLAEDTGSSK